MEITKITFDEAKYGAAFEDLDVNNDGKINNDDLKVAQNNTVKSQIQNVLNDVDDEPTLVKAGAKKSSITKDTDVSNFDKDVKNSKGVVYVVMGNLGACGWCNQLETAIEKNKDSLGNCQIYNMSWADDKNNNLCWSLYKQTDYYKTHKSGAYPTVLKFVDGKLVDVVGNPRNTQKTINDMINGTKDATATTETTPTTETTGTEDTNKAGATTAKTVADIKKAAEDLVAKYPPEHVTGNYDPYTSNNPELSALKKAMSDGAIDALAKEGFSRTDIVDIISQAYPTSGIKKNDKGGYDCPLGRDDAAKEIYNMFVEQLGKVTSPNANIIGQVKELNVQIFANNAKLNELKGAITLVQKEVEELVEAAIKDSENIAEEQKAESAKIVREELNKYASSNGEVSYEDFQKGLNERLNLLDTDGSIKLSATVSKLLHAESKMGTLKGYLNSFKNLVDENKTLADKVAALKNTPDVPDTPCEPNRCDPIGFQVNGKRYDFFVDKDNNNDLTNENEFLGAQNGWAEMKALDTDNDGKVSQAEMKDLKLVTTDDAGKQVVKSAADIFGATDSIDLNSYKSVNQDFENGNTLLGTFSMTVGGQTVNDAYNTMDTLNWLDENYEFTDEAAGTGRYAKDNTTPEEILRFEKDFDAFQATYTKLETDLGTAWNKIGIERADVAQTIQDKAKEAEGAEAKAIEELFKKKEKAAATSTDTETPPAAEEEK